MAVHSQLPDDVCVISQGSCICIDRDESARARAASNPGDFHSRIYGVRRNTSGARQATSSSPFLVKFTAMLLERWAIAMHEALPGSCEHRKIRAYS